MNKQLVDSLQKSLGISQEQSPEPLIRMKDLIAERTGTNKDAVGTYFKLNPKVSDLPEQYWHEIYCVKILVLGALTQAGHFEEAGYAARIIRDDHLRASALRDLAAALGRAGRIYQAQEIASTIQDELFKASAQRAVVVALSRIGRFGEAMGQAFTGDQRSVECMSGYAAPGRSRAGYGSAG